jgi:5-aminopentanamidase
VVAAFQTADVQADSGAAVAVLKECAGRAEAAGADVALFPEGFLDGYTRERAQAHRRATELGSRSFRDTLGALVNCEPVLVFGIIERRGGALFNTAVVVHRGRLIGAYRKRHPNEGWSTAGRELPVFTLRTLRLGVGICSDARDRDDAACLATKRVDAILYPLNNLLPLDVAARWRDRHAQVLVERARQTGAWAISADVVGRGDECVGFGCTVAVDGHGVVRQRVPESCQGMVLARVAAPTLG